MRGWIGFVEGMTIDWCIHPKLSRTDLRELMVQILFEIMKVVSPPVFRAS